MTLASDMLKEDVASGRPFTDEEKEALFKMLAWTDAQQQALMRDISQLKTTGWVQQFALYLGAGFLGYFIGAGPW